MKETASFTTVDMSSYIWVIGLGNTARYVVVTNAQ